MDSAAAGAGGETPLGSPGPQAPSATAGAKMARRRLGACTSRSAQPGCSPRRSNVLTSTASVVPKSTFTRSHRAHHDSSRSAAGVSSPGMAAHSAGAWKSMAAAVLVLFDPEQDSDVQARCPGTVTLPVTFSNSLKNLNESAACLP